MRVRDCGQHEPVASELLCRPGRRYARSAAHTLRYGAVFALLEAGEPDPRGVHLVNWLRKSVERRRIALMSPTRLPRVALDTPSALQREQLEPLLEQAQSENDADLIQRFEVLDEPGAHLYDLHLFWGDDGPLSKAGKLEHIVSFSQGGAIGSEDARVLSSLDAAFGAWTASSEGRASW